MIGGRHRCFLFVNRKLRLMPMVIAILVVLIGRRNINNYSNLIDDIQTQRHGDNFNSYLSLKSSISHETESNNHHNETGGDSNQSISSNNRSISCWKRIGPKGKLHPVANCHQYSDAAAQNITIYDLEPELAFIPIYLVNLSASSKGLFDGGSVLEISYANLTSNWDRNTSYKDILLKSRQSTATRTTSCSNSSQQQCRSNKDLWRHNLRLRRDSNNSQHKNNNVTLIFHTSPKMASSTLRKACIDVQTQTCPNMISSSPQYIRNNNNNSNTSWKMPDGYRSPSRLIQLLIHCPNTKHFCQMEGIPLTLGYITNTHVYTNRTFLHMFPFRQYNTWAKSALHQVSYREGEGGCNETNLLLDECIPHRYELDFDKYTKSNMAKFIRSLVHVVDSSSTMTSSTTTVVEGVRNKDEENEYNDDDDDNNYYFNKEDVMSRHQILLYDYLYLHETIHFLSSNSYYGITNLPGTEMKINTALTPLESGKERVQLTPCLDEMEILNKFHRCFSNELGPLY